MYAVDPRKSFRALVADQLLASLISAMSDQDREKKGNTVLVVDDEALAVLNAAVPQSEVLKAGFMMVTPCETKDELADNLRRRKYPQLDVLYFMRSTSSNISKVLMDYAQDVFPDEGDLIERCFPCLFRGISSLDIEPPWYADARVLLIPHVDVKRGMPPTSAAGLEREIQAVIDDSVDNRKKYARFLSAWKRESPTKELVTGTRGADAARRKCITHLSAIAYRIMTALVTMNELPYVRYSHSERGYSEEVARSLVKMLRAYQETHPGFTPWGTIRDDDLGGPGGRVLRAGEPPEPATVIIVDRVDDLAPALLHETTYSCLVTDLLDHTPCTPYLYTYTKGEQTVKKEVLLDESDPIWRHIRYEDMATVIDVVDEGVYQARERDEQRKHLDRENVNDLRQLMAAIASDEKLVTEKFSQHYRMKKNIVAAFEQHNIHAVVGLEQILVTGCDEAGDRVKSADVENRMREMMQDTRLTSADKARLLILFLLCHKQVDDRTRQQLIRAAQLKPKHESAILNLVDLSIPLTRKASDPRAEAAPFYDDETLKRNRTRAKESTRLCRYITKLEDVVRQHVDDKLDVEMFPWVTRPPARDSRATQAATADPKANLTSVALSRAAHGDVVNRLAAEVLASTTAGAAATVQGKRAKKSRFGAAGAADADGDATPGVSGRPEDPWTKYLEPPRPRVYQGGRVIVFVVGGVTQLELAAMDRLSRDTGREIIVGGTSLLTPRDFLDDLSSIQQGVEEEDDYRGAAAAVSSAAGTAAGGTGSGRSARADSDED